MKTRAFIKHCIVAMHCKQNTDRWDVFRVTVLFLLVLHESHMSFMVAMVTTDLTIHHESLSKNGT